MKTIALVGAAVVALTCVCVLVEAQGGLRRGASPAPTIPVLGNAQPNGLVIPTAAGDVPLSALAPAREQEFRVQVLPWAGRRQPPSTLFDIPTNAYQTALSNHLVVPSPASAVRPGVYKTEPYTCIVVVPGAHPDDRCIMNPGGGHSSMPIIKPDLRFIPLAPAPAR